MHARLINEKFTEQSDPIQDMGLGLKNNPKILLPMVIKKLKEFGINAEVKKSFEFGNGHYEIYVNGNSDDEVLEVQYFYSTDKAAHEEGWKGGFALSDDGGADLCKVSHDPMVSIKVLLKRKYGTKAKIAKYIDKAEKKIAFLKEVEKIID
jgi:hypothetical protein